jgi:hypothetical protein
MIERPKFATYAEALAYERVRARALAHVDPIDQRWHERTLAEPDANKARLARWRSRQRWIEEASSCG